jgi:hypothetical protein
MFIITAAPPKRAAAPTQPVRIAGASCELVVVDRTPPGFAEVATGGGVPVGAGTLLVNGIPFDAVPAEGKAGDCVRAVGLGVALGLPGFRTLIHN